MEARNIGKVGDLVETRANSDGVANPDSFFFHTFFGSWCLNFLLSPAVAVIVVFFTDMVPTMTIDYILSIV